MREYPAQAKLPKNNHARTAFRRAGKPSDSLLDILHDFDKIVKRPHLIFFAGEKHIFGFAR